MHQQVQLGAIALQLLKLTYKYQRWLHTGTLVTQKLFLCLFIFFIACKIFILKHLHFFPSVHLKLSANNRGIHHARTHSLFKFFMQLKFHINSLLLKYTENYVNDVFKRILCIPTHLKDSNPCCCKHSPGTSRQSPSLFHSCYLIFIVLAHSKAKEGEGQSSGSRKYHALCDHLPNTSLMSWRGATLAGCTGSIRIANCVTSSRTTTRFFLNLMLFDQGEGERKGGQGSMDEKERPTLL